MHLNRVGLYMSRENEHYKIPCCNGIIKREGYTTCSIRTITFLLWNWKKCTDAAEYNLELYNLELQFHLQIKFQYFCLLFIRQMMNFPQDQKFLRVF